MFLKEYYSLHDRAVCKAFCLFGSVRPSQDCIPVRKSAPLLHYIQMHLCVLQIPCNIVLHRSRITGSACGYGLFKKFHLLLCELHTSLPCTLPEIIIRQLPR